MHIRDAATLANSVTEPQIWIGDKAEYQNAGFKYQVKTASPGIARFQSTYQDGSLGDAAFIELAGASSVGDRRYLGIHGSSNTFYISTQTY